MITPLFIFNNTDKNLVLSSYGQHPVEFSSSCFVVDSNKFEYLKKIALLKPIKEKKID
jgi:hypothetical protein